MDLEICSSSSLPLVFSSSVNGNSGEESPTGSPVMWRPGSTHFKYCHSPMSCRAQEIAKGRQELLKLMEGMPESAYELSLSDLVETRETTRKSFHGDKQNPNQEEQKQQENTNNTQKCFPQQKQQVKEKGKPQGMSKISSKSWKPNAPKNQVLLNIFVPKSIAYGSIPSHHKSSKPASPVASPCAKRIDSNHSIGSRLKSAVHSLLKLMRIKGGLFSSYGTSGFSKVSPKPISGKDNNKSEKLLPSAAAAPPPATEGFPIAANEMESDANSDSKRHLLSRAASYFSRTSSRQDSRGSCKSIKRHSKDADIISFHGNRGPELRRSGGCIPCISDSCSY